MPSNGFCTNEEKLPVTFSYATAAGRPAQVQGDTTVTVTSGDGTFERTGAHSGFLVSGDNAGDTVYAHDADADLGEGVVSINDVMTLTVSGAQAAAVGVAFGAPVPK